MMVRSSVRLATLASCVLAFGLPLQSRACGVDPVITGLDPTVPLTALSLQSAGKRLTSNARESARALDISVALDGGSEIAVSLPFRESLSIDAVGSAQGLGDASLRYTRPVSCGDRWRTAAIAGASLATGNENFSSGGAFTASYALSYRLLRPLSIVVVPSYTFPIARRRADAASTQTLGLLAKGIVSLPHGVYGAAAAEQRDVSGTYRYQARLASFTLGEVIANRYNASLFYEMPVTKFAYDHVEHFAFGARLSFQR